MSKLCASSVVKGKSYSTRSKHMRTGKFHVSFIAMFVMLVSFTQGVGAGEVSLRRLEGSWGGEGMFMGNRARLELKYEWVLNGKFLRLSLNNESRTQAGERQVFEGHAYYEAKSDGSVSGTWFDSRGVSFALKGSFEGDTLTVLWGGSDQEQGKSVYRLVEANRLEVTDSVKQKNGEWRQFASAVVTRQ